MDLICFSHLRWNFVYQRPQHLLSRFTRHYRVFYIEEAVDSEIEDGYSISLINENIWVIVPKIQNLYNSEDGITRHYKILNKLFVKEGIKNYIFWYYTPMALPISSHFDPALIVYDCMDELSAFKFANPMLKDLEKQLFKKADIVFTGGNSLYQLKKYHHHNVHFYPSSIDKEHFLKARLLLPEPIDQQSIPYPRFGFFGVLDERFDINLIEQIATLKPDWQFIFIGPVVKIDPDALPRKSNIHYLGYKSYEVLPSYISGWNIAIIPFALNEATRYISPTKTPEYLAAGKPVISSSIKDVVIPYGEKKFVHIINTPEQFIEKADSELTTVNKDKWLANVDRYLAKNSWDKTWFNMHELIINELHFKKKLLTEKQQAYV